MWGFCCFVWESDLPLLSLKANGHMKHNVHIIGASAMAMIDELTFAQHAREAIETDSVIMIEPEKPKPIEKLLEVPLYNPHVDDVIHPFPFHHPKRTRKSEPLKIGSYKQKRKK